MKQDEIKLPKLTELEAEKLKRIEISKNLIRAEEQNLRLRAVNLEQAEKMKKLEIANLEVLRTARNQDAQVNKNIFVRLKAEEEELNKEICERLKIVASGFTYDLDTLEVTVENIKEEKPNG